MVNEGKRGEQLHGHPLGKGGHGGEHEEGHEVEGEEDDVDGEEGELLAEHGLPLQGVGSHEHDHHGHRDLEEEQLEVDSP